jgi:hypothetical protein
MEATQRGRRCALQVCLDDVNDQKRRRLGSSVTDLSVGAGGALMFDHSSMMVRAGAGAACTRKAANAASDNS